VVGLFVIAYFAEIAHYTVHFERNLLPLEGPLLVLAAIGLCHTANWITTLAARLPMESGMRWAGAVGCTILVLIPLLHSATDAARLTQDERRSAQTWISKHVPAGDNVVLEAWSPWVDPNKYSVQGENLVGDLPLLWFSEHHIDYVVLTERQFGQILSDPHYAREYRNLFAAFPTVAVFNSSHLYNANSRDNQVDFWDNRIYVLDVQRAADCALSRCGPPTPIADAIPAASKSPGRGPN